MTLTLPSVNVYNISRDTDPKSAKTGDVSQTGDVWSPYIILCIMPMNVIINIHKNL